MNADPQTSSAPTASANGAPDAPAGAEAGRSYKDTLNLPKTAFPMKANLVQNEPASLKRWAGLAAGKGLYRALTDARKQNNQGRFVFHDGPPYANGSIHMGHLMNKTLKDFVVRSKAMAGLHCPYVPGWDCHGLPIEHKVMTELKDAGKLDKFTSLEEGARKMAVRRECKKYAEKFVKLHVGQMSRLLTLADYDDPYLTMNPAYEGATLEVLADLVEQGLVYRALKPVHWSVDNQTALAEAELEYEDREDLSVYVDFEAENADAVYDAFGLFDDDEASSPSVSEGFAADTQSDEGSDSHEQEPEPRRPTQRPSFMIWTTTPWTLPANLAVAVNPKFEYALVKIDGNVTVLAAAAVERVTKAAKSEDVKVLATATGDKLLGLRYRHPFVDLAKAEGAPDAQANPSNVFRLVAAEYVTLEDGTGLVHTAPGHGTEDYQTGLRERLPIYCPVRGDGTYDDTVPAWLRGKSIWKANAEVAEHLRQSGHMFFDHVFTHSYPHDWRSKGPVIFRCTEQWFVSVDQKFGVPGEPSPFADRSLRTRAMDVIGLNLSQPQTPLQLAELSSFLEHLRALQSGDSSRLSTPPDSWVSRAAEYVAGRPDRCEEVNKWMGCSVRFVPEWGRNRMRGMLDARPDWCISRQRAWGLPIPAFFTPSGECLMTAASVRAVAKVFREKGSDAWFTLSPAELLAHYDPSTDSALFPSMASWLGGGGSLPSLVKGGDILDVWFESGSSWNAVMRERGMAHEDKPYFVDLYLEGSDQHRGWFQLSLLPALGATGKTPFHTLLTHGFMVDKDGRKLSKSKGDSVDDLFQKYGADVMRWWVCSLSYDNDVKVDSSFFELAGESYRKVRNTLRFMLSNLDDFAPSCDGKAGHCVDAKDFAPTSLDAWVLAEYDRLAAQVTSAFDAYDFSKAHELLYDFCNRTLSAVYLAAVKDRLYCDKPDSLRRRRTQTALWDLTDGLCRLLAPVLVHTADEAYRSLRKADPKDADACVHLNTYVRSFGVKADDAWPAAIEAVESARLVLEQAKAELGVKDPLDAGVVLPDPDGKLARFDPVDLADLLGVSRVELDPKADKPRVLDLRAEPQCERSWKRDGTVRKRSDGGMLSDRDAQAVGVG